MIKKSPIVYIIISIYNGEKFFLDQLMSIYYQNYDNWYLIVVDDGSTDSSLIIAKKFVADYKLENKVKIIKQKNQGTCKAVEKGLIEVQHLNKGENLVALCDADDVRTRDKLEKQVIFMFKNNDCNLCFHDMAIIDQDNKLISKSFFKDQLKFSNPNCNTFFELAIGNHITTTEIMFRVKDIDLILPIPDIGAKDWRTVLNFSINNKKISYIDLPLAYYRQGHSSIQKRLSENGCIMKTKRVIETFKALRIKYFTKELEYIMSYYEDRFSLIKKGYSERMSLLVMLKYPKIFFSFIKNIFQKTI